MENSKGSIESFRPELKSYFKQINIEWLEEFFYVEDYDLKILDECEKTIIEPGGHIFFYREEGQIVGTVALIFLSEGVFELAKMGVTRSWRGKGIGQQLIAFCIDFARKEGWKKLVLYSNRTLDNSIHIYKKFGFEEIPLEADNPYSRGDIKMELILSVSV